MKRTRRPRNRDNHLYRRRLFLEQLEDRRMLAGLTIITHGFQPTGGMPDWPEDMANEIIGKVAGSGKLIEFDFDNAQIADNVTGTLVSNSETVVVYNWASKSNNLAEGHSEPGWREAAGDLLANWLLGTSANPGLARQAVAANAPIHFIAHSFGAVVNSEAIRRLGAYRITVDQMTTLDAHYQDQAGIPDAQNDPAVKVWSNVRFADNYWEDVINDRLDPRDNRETDPLQNPVGMSDFGAAERNLSTEVDYNESDDGLPVVKDSAPHSKVHGWYYETIRGNPEPGGFGENTGDNWYAPYSATSHGYWLSHNGAGSGSRSNLSSLKMSEFTASQIDPVIEQTVFNGDLRHYAPDAISRDLPGYDDDDNAPIYNAGGSHGYVIKLSNCITCSDVTHRPVFFSELARAFSFAYNVTTNNSDDLFTIRLGSESSSTIDISQMNEGWREEQMAIPSSLHDKFRSINFELTAPGLVNTVGSVVLVDEMRVLLAPVADAGGPYSARLGTTIELDASASYDLDGTITKYEWDLDNDGQYDDATGMAANFQRATADTYAVGVRVTDSDGYVSTGSTSVLVQAAEAPMATIMPFIFFNSGSTTLDFDVQYAGPKPIDITTIGDGDWIVHGEEFEVVKIGEVVAETNDNTVWATYRITAPTGRWKMSDNGVYYLRLAEDAVRDVDGTSADHGLLFLFAIKMSPFGTRDAIVLTAHSTTSVKTGDLDGDGDLDIVLTAKDDDKIAWYVNHGKGVFGRQQVISKTPRDPESVFLADINDDGSLDILVASSGNSTIEWYSNDGQGGFQSRPPINTNASNVSYVIASDLDGDGDQDVVWASSFNHTVAWQRNLGDGQFDAAVEIASVARPSRVESVDIDGDGLNDIVIVSDSSTGKIRWYRNEGNGDFGDKNKIGSHAGKVSSIVVVDIDSDGDKDVVAISSTSYQQVSSSRIAIYFNDDNGVFSAPYSAPYYVAENEHGLQTITTADIDNDGDQDLVAAVSQTGREDYILWYENSGGSQFDKKHQIEVLTPNTRMISVLAADMDGNGTQDLVATTGGLDDISWYPNQGDLSFGVGVPVAPRMIRPSHVSAADMDGDGDLDVVAASLGNFAWFENTADNRFDDPQHTVARTSGSNSDWYNEFAIADFDSDGDADIVSVSDTNIAWHRNDGNGGFVEPIILDSDRGSSVRAVDLDGDDDVDIVVLSRSPTNGPARIVWYENQGNGVFGSRRYIYENSPYPFSAAVMLIDTADLDGDGDQDVLFVRQKAYSQVSKTVWKPNLGGGTFGEEILIAESVAIPTHLAVGDMDGDGDADVVTSFVRSLSAGPTVSWFENRGIGLLYDEHQIDDVDTHDGYAGIEVFQLLDLNGDGDADIVAASYSSDDGYLLFWYENEASGAFGLRQDISAEFEATYDGINSIAAADIDGDGDLDLVFDSMEVTWMENRFDIDTTPPNPLTTQWATAPSSAGHTSIRMTAVVAYDVSGVEYRFECTSTGCHDREWDEDPVFVDAGLQAGTFYQYRTLTRDKSTRQYESTPSFIASARTAMPWNNFAAPLDVTDDGNVSPLDALSLINKLNSDGSGVLPTERSDRDNDMPFYDVNDDGHFSSIDVLMIVNDLNHPRDQEGESSLARIEFPPVAVFSDSRLPTPLRTNDAVRALPFAAYQQSVDDSMRQLADDPAVLQQSDHDQLTSTAGTDESLDEWFERELPDLVE